jgi:hypothetical protein
MFECMAVMGWSKITTIKTSWFFAMGLLILQQGGFSSHHDRLPREKAKVCKAS